MTTLGIGATCCQQADCDIDCGFDKSTAPASEPPAPPQVIEPPEAVQVDSVEHNVDENPAEATDA